MDSSDGLRNTLTTLCMVNPSAEITVDADAIPVHPDVAAFCKSSGMPKQGFFLGSGGEYELVIGVYPGQREAFEKACRKGEATCIGSLTKSDNPGLFWQKTAESPAKPDMPLQIDPRFHKDRQGYIEEILKVTHHLFS
jgi:thiamine monophosphate kinase